MTAYSVCILEFQQGWQPRGVRILNSRFVQKYGKFAGMTKVNFCVQARQERWYRSGTMSATEWRFTAELRLDSELLATESDVKRWGGFF